MKLIKHPNVIKIIEVTENNLLNFLFNTVKRNP